MKLIKNLLKSIKNKFIMKHLGLLLGLAAYYESYLEKNPDDKDAAGRLTLLEVAIDLGADELLESIDKLQETETSNESQETQEKVETPEKDKEQASEEETLEEAVVQIPILHKFSIQKEGGKKKEIKIDGPTVGSLPAFVDDETAEKFDNIYPTVGQLDDILTEAWDMICREASNKETNDYLHKELGKYYGKIFKTNGEWYKVTNTYQKAIKTIKGAFGENVRDGRIVVTKPYETEGGAELVLVKDKDMTVLEPEKKEEKESKEEPELETIQDLKDEEKQEEEIAKAEAEAEETPEETPEETGVQEEASGEEATVDETPESEKTEEPEVDTSEVPPPVNKYDDFNDLEESIFDIMENAEKAQKAEEDPAKKKAIRKEAREQARLLVQSYFDNAQWAQKNDDGTWSTELLNYVNGIVQECSKHYS